MANIEREAIVVDGPSDSLDHSLLWQSRHSAQWPEPEGGPVALMRRMMIRDSRGRDAVLLEAKGAQRLDHQLILGPFLPPQEAFAQDQRSSRHTTFHSSASAPHPSQPGPL